MNTVTVFYVQRRARGRCPSHGRVGGGSVHCKIGPTSDGVNDGQRFGSTPSTHAKDCGSRRALLTDVAFAELGLRCRKGDETGQRKVNTFPPEHPRRPELIWLNRVFRRACPSHTRAWRPLLIPRSWVRFPP